MYNNNFYPYNYGYAKPGMFSRLSSLAGKAKLNWSNVLNNTQKTLNIINQAIPVFYQIKPIYNNAKTIFRVMNAVKEPDITIKPVNQENINVAKNTNATAKVSKNINDKPTFFL